MILLYILYALVGISIMIFIHESGHFLAAKRVGVRVERFSLGFDPPFRGRPLRFFSFRRGETEYVLGMIPFGGYVKLAGGEFLADPDHKPADDELPSKSVGARALVFAAGSLMNIASAFIFFMIAFTLGVSFYSPKVGTVLSQSPAWEAGLKPGDTIISIDGDPVVDYTEMRFAVVLGKSSQPLAFRVARQDGAHEEVLDLSVTPRFDTDLGFNEIGVTPAYSDIIEAPKPGSAADKAGLRKGDRIIGVEYAGQTLPPLPMSLLFNSFHDFSILRPDEVFRLKIEREGVALWVAITPRKDPKGEPGPQIGVHKGLGNVVRGIQRGSGASRVFQPGDRLATIDGQPVLAVFWLSVVENHPGKEGKHDLELVSASGARRTVALSREDLLAWTLREEIAWDGFNLEVATIDPESPLAAAGLRTGDVLAGIGGKPCHEPEDIAKILLENPANPLELQILRDGNPEVLRVDRKDLSIASRVVWRHLRPIAGVVRGGPAERAGISSGSRIVEVAGTKVLSWEQMSEVLGEAQIGKEVAIAWRAPEGDIRRGSVVVGLDPMEPIGIPIEVDQKTVRVGVLESFAMGAKRTFLASQQIFLTLKSLIRRDVSAKNLSGPVGITHLLTKIVEQGNLSTLIFYLALISIHLGLFNLLPFPILDGGHLLFLAIEKVKGSPVDVRVQEWAMNIAFICILFLAVFVTFNDIKRLLQ